MRFTDALTSPLAWLRAGALAVAFGVLASAPTPALAQDNPLGLIDPAVISVGTMGDAKPYADTAAGDKRPLTCQSGIHRFLLLLDIPAAFVVSSQSPGDRGYAQAARS